MGYLRNGLSGRAMHHIFSQREGRIPQLDFVFNFSSHLDYNCFGAHISGYYRQVIINKRKMYEEFGQLLGEFESISIQFRISPPRELMTQHKMDDKSMQLILANEEESAIEIEDPQSRNLSEEIATVTAALKDKMSRQSCYDATDITFLQKFSKERKNVHFFTLKKLQCMLGK
jgi:hypothetical protein